MKQTSLQRDNKAQQKELKEIQTEIDKFYQRIQNARSMRLDDEFTADEFKEIKTDLLIIGSMLPEKLIFPENKL